MSSEIVFIRLLMTRSPIDGNASSASTPMMPTTIITSMIVKPFARRRRLIALPLAGLRPGTAQGDVPVHQLRAQRRRRDQVAGRRAGGPGDGDPVEGIKATGRLGVGAGEALVGDVQPRGSRNVGVRARIEHVLLLPVLDLQHQLLGRGAVRAP